MIATTEGLADFRQAVLGQLTRQPHGYLTWPGDDAATFFGVHVGDFKLVVIGDRFLDQFQGELAVGLRRKYLSGHLWPHPG